MLVGPCDFLCVIMAYCVCLCVCLGIWVCGRLIAYLCVFVLVSLRVCGFGVFACLWVGVLVSLCVFGFVGLRVCLCLCVCVSVSLCAVAFL